MTEITDPQAREQAQRLTAAIRDARLTGYTTKLLSGAERDLLLALEVRLDVRLGEMATPNHTPGLDLARFALDEIERDATRQGGAR